MELLHIAICLLSLCFKLNYAAYIGISSSESIPLQDEEFDRSRVPMIRLLHQNSGFLRPSRSINISPTDNEPRQKSDITALPREARKFEDILKQRSALDSGAEGNEGDSSSNSDNDEIQMKDGEDEEKRKEFLFPNEGACTVDGQKILNSEEIFQNECGTLQCINSEVTWSLKPLAKTVPHCEGIKSIPSMFNSYTKIKVVDEDDGSQEKTIRGKTSKPTDIDADIIDQRKRIQEASSKMIEAEKWD